MAESKYEKYVVRKAALVIDEDTDEVPETEDIPIKNDADSHIFQAFCRRSEFDR